jgi:hypothetical protein
MSGDKLQVANNTGFTAIENGTIRHSELGYMHPLLVGESEPGCPTSGTPERFNRPGIYEGWNIDVGEALKIIGAQNERISKLEIEMATLKDILFKRRGS